MNIKNIIWDFDGTLFDTYESISSAFADSLHAEHQITVPKSKIYELVKIDTKHCAAMLAREYKIDPVLILNKAREYYNSFNSISQHPFPFVELVVNRIADSGGHNFIVTHRDESSLVNLLQNFGPSDKFTEIITSDDGFPKKPDSTSFNHLIKKYNLHIKTTYAIGDRDLDIEAANRAGIPSIFFCPLGQTNRNATVCISCFSKI